MDVLLDEADNECGDLFPVSSWPTVRLNRYCSYAREYEKDRADDLDLMLSSEVLRVMSAGCW